MITVYHGTDDKSAKKICNGINVEAGSKGTDFGLGFYVTEDYDSAVKWAYHKSYVRHGKPAVVVAYFDVETASPLIEKFEDDLRWGRFVINNRNGMEYIKRVAFKDNNLDARYPITYGRIADLGVMDIAEQLNASGEMLMSLDDILNLNYPMQYAFHKNDVTRFLVGLKYRYV